MDGWVGEWMGGWMDGWVNEWMGGWLSEYMIRNDIIQHETNDWLRCLRSVVVQLTKAGKMTCLLSDWRSLWCSDDGGAAAADDDAGSDGGRDETGGNDNDDDEIGADDDDNEDNIGAEDGNDEDVSGDDDEDDDEDKEGGLRRWRERELDGRNGSGRVVADASLSVVVSPLLRGVVAYIVCCCCCCCCCWSDLGAKVLLLNASLNLLFPSFWTFFAQGEGL